jgi:hypothetical protein
MLALYDHGWKPDFVQTWHGILPTDLDARNEGMDPPGLRRPLSQQLDGSQCSECTHG